MKFNSQATKSMTIFDKFEIKPNVKNHVKGFKVLGKGLKS